jgi:hypothetical protein
MRERYLQTIADQLFGEPSDAAVAQAVNRALNLASAFVGFDTQTRGANHGQT